MNSNTNAQRKKTMPPPNPKGHGVGSSDDALKPKVSKAQGHCFGSPDSAKFGVPAKTESSNGLRSFSKSSHSSSSSTPITKTPTSGPSGTNRLAEKLQSIASQRSSRKTLHVSESEGEMSHQEQIHFIASDCSRISERKSDASKKDLRVPRGVNHHVSSRSPGFHGHQSVLSPRPRTSSVETQRNLTDIGRRSNTASSNKAPNRSSASPSVSPLSNRVNNRNRKQSAKKSSNSWWCCCNWGSNNEKKNERRPVLQSKKTRLRGDSESYGSAGSQSESTPIAEQDRFGVGMKGNRQQPAGVKSFWESDVEDEAPKPKGPMNVV